MSRSLCVVYVWLSCALPALAQQTAQNDQAPPPKRPSIGLLVISDFSHVPRAANLAILAAGAGLSLAEAPHDRVLTRDLSAAPTWELALDSGATIGDGTVQVGGAVATYVI